MKSPISNVWTLILLSFSIFLFTATIVDAKNNTEGQVTLEVKTGSVDEESDKNNVITNKGAWCWFADPRALHHENKEGTINNSYIGYIDVHGNIKATQYNFITKQSNEVLIRSYFQPDDHNNPSFLILPDNRVMIFYSRHTDEACFYYRVSKKAGDITSLGPELKILTKFNTTYPSPFILSSDPDHFYLCWRGIKWHPTIARYTLPDESDHVVLNRGPFQMIQSTAARPYCKYYSNKKDKIYLTYTLGHPDNELPNFTFLNYIDVTTMQLKDVTGKVLSSIMDGPHNVNQVEYPKMHPNAIVDSPSDQRDWIWQTTLNKKGNPVMAMVQISPDKRTHNYFYAWWTGSEWKKTFLVNGGGHFHQSAGLELCYSGGMAIDDTNPEDVYCSVPISGMNGKVYELIKYSVDEQGNVSSKEQITANSLQNNIRPFVVANSSNSPLKLVWMYGEYYDWIVSSTHPEGFPTAIYGDFSFPQEKSDLNKAISINETFNGKIKGTAHTEKGMLVTSKSTFAKLKSKQCSTFTVTLTLSVNEEAFEGVILNMGNMVYGLDGTTMKPYFKIGDITHHSTNLLGNSDGWKSQSRGTGGKWWPAVKPEFFKISITVDSQEIRVYINGLIDQVIESENLMLEDLTLGGFNGLIKECNVYQRSLSQQEINSLNLK